MLKERFQRPRVFRRQVAADQDLPHKTHQPLPDGQQQHDRNAGSQRIGTKAGRGRRIVLGRADFV